MNPTLVGAQPLNHNPASHHAVHAGPAYGGDDRGDGGRHYVQAVPAKAGASDEGCVPWAPAAGKAAETSSQAQESLRADDSLWLEVSAWGSQACENPFFHAQMFVPLGLPSRLHAVLSHAKSSHFWSS